MNINEGNDKVKLSHRSTHFCVSNEVDYEILQRFRF